jgi:hypothetical protein
MGFDSMTAGTPVQVRLQDDELSALDSYRREKLNPPSRRRAHIALFGSAISPNPALSIAGECELISSDGTSK